MAQNSDPNPEADRRSEKRVLVAADIEWATAGELNPGRLGDLSPSGCFVLAPGEFTDGEIVRLYFPSNDGSRVEILSEVRNYVEDIGFAVRFVSLSEIDREFIRNFAKTHEIAGTEA